MDFNLNFGDGLDNVGKDSVGGKSSVDSKDESDRVSGADITNTTNLDESNSVNDRDAVVGGSSIEGSSTNENVVHGSGVSIDLNFGNMGVGGLSTGSLGVGSSRPPSFSDSVTDNSISASGDVWIRDWLAVSGEVGTLTGNDDRLVLVSGLMGNDLVWGQFYYALTDMLEDRGVRIERLSGRLDLGISEKFVSEVSRMWTTVMKVKNVTDKQIVDLTYRYMMDPLVSVDVDNRIRNYLMGYVSGLREKYSNLDMVKNHYMKMFHWIELYVPKLVSVEAANGVVGANNGVSCGNSVCVLFEGDLKVSEIEFMKLLVELGVTIVVFDSEKRGKRDGFGMVLELSEAGKFSVLSKLEMERRTVKRQDTVAKAAHEEIRNLLHRDSEGLFAPWQFEEYMVENVLLNTTYEEIYLYWNEGVQMRPGFGVSSERVKRGDRLFEGTMRIPNMFVKVRGVSEHIERYWMDFEHLRDGKIVEVRDRFPFTRSVYVHRRGIVLRDGRFPVEDVKGMSEYRFHHIRGSMQDLMIEKMNEMIEDRSWLVERYRDDYDMAFRILHNVLNLESRFVEMLQKYDFGGDIPKLVIFDGDEAVASVDDVIVMNLLYKLGFDVVVMTPTGYENVEHVMNREYLDIHKLHRFEMGLRVPEVTVRNVSEESNRRGGLFKRIFD